MKKGFTIIELITTIVVIAVITGIVTVSTVKIIDKNKRMTLKTNATQILTTLEYEVIENGLNPLDLNGETPEYILITVLALEMNKDNYNSINFSCAHTENSQCDSYSITIVGKNKWDGYSITGTKDNLVIE